MNEFPEQRGDGEAIGEDDLLDREVWEGLSIELIGLDPEARLDVLARREVDPEIYAASEERFVDAMVEEIQAGDRSHAERYGLRCAEALARRRAAGPIEAGGEVGLTPEVVDAAPPPPRPTGDEVPTFLRAPMAAPAPVVAPPVVVGQRPAASPLGKTLAGAAPTRPTMPFVSPPRGVPSPLAQPQAAPRPAAEVDPLDRTAETPDGVIPSPALPFGGAKKEGA